MYNHLCILGIANTVSVDHNIHSVYIVSIFDMVDIVNVVYIITSHNLYIWVNYNKK